jgi:quercetin dioxygenase-like cupin family protein
MSLPTFAEFEAAARAAGATEVLERRWAPGLVLDTHTHPFRVVDALVVDGEMWLTCGDETRRLVPGDRFALPPALPHAERYGPAGAVYWVGRG